MSYDSSCFDLAESFLQDEPKATSADTDALAQQIQDAIETFLTCELPDRIAARAAPDHDRLREDRDERRRMEREP